MSERENRPDFKTRVALRALRRQLEEEIGDRGPQIESRLGWAPGRLAELLQSEVDLRVDDLMQILFAAEIDPGSFLGKLPATYGAAESEDG